MKTTMNAANIAKYFLLTVVLGVFAGPLWAGRNPEPATGWQALKEKRYDDAQREAESVLNRKPQDEDANWLAAEVALAQGDTTRSLGYWYVVLEEDQTHPRAVLNTVEILISRNELDKAQQILDAALAQARKPDLPEYLYSQGVLLNAEGQDADAMVRISQAIDKNPREPLFYVALARIYEKKKVLALAIENYRQAIALDSTNADLRYSLGKDLMDSKQYSEALNEFKATKALDANYPNVHYQIGKLYFYAEKYDEAVVELAAALKNAKEQNFFFCSIYGQALREVKQLEEAQEYLEKAYGMRPAEISTARSLALNSFELKKYDRAIEVYKQIIASPDAEPGDYAKVGEAYYNLAGQDSQSKALYDSAAVYLKKGYELNPQSTRLPNLIAATYFNVDQYDSAAVYYEIIASQDSTNYQAFYKLGYCYLKLERYKETIAKLRRALAIDSTKVPAHMMLAQTLTFVDSTRSARQEFQKVIQLDPNQGDAYGALGFIYLREASALPEDAQREVVKEAWGRCAAQFRRATELSPKSVAYWIGYGHSSYNIRDYDTAVRAFNTALRLDPGNKDAKNGLEAAETMLKRQPRK